MNNIQSHASPLLIATANLKCAHKGYGINVEDNGFCTVCRPNGCQRSSELPGSPSMARICPSCFVAITPSAPLSESSSLLPDELIHIPHNLDGPQLAASFLKMSTSFVHPANLDVLLHDQTQPPPQSSWDHPPIEAFNPPIGISCDRQGRILWRKPPAPHYSSKGEVMIPRLIVPNVQTCTSHDLKAAIRPAQHSIPNGNATSSVSRTRAIDPRLSLHPGQSSSERFHRTQPEIHGGRQMSANIIQTQDHVRFCATSGCGRVVPPQYRGPWCPSCVQGSSDISMRVPQTLVSQGSNRPDVTATKQWNPENATLISPVTMAPEVTSTTLTHPPYNVTDPNFKHRRHLGTLRHAAVMSTGSHSNGVPLAYPSSNVANGRKPESSTHLHTMAMRAIRKKHDMTTVPISQQRRNELHLVDSSASITTSYAHAPKVVIDLTSSNERYEGKSESSICMPDPRNRNSLNTSLPTSIERKLREASSEPHLVHSPDGSNRERIEDVVLPEANHTFDLQPELMVERAEALLLEHIAARKNCLDRMDFSLSCFLDTMQPEGASDGALGKSASLDDDMMTRDQAAGYISSEEGAVITISSDVAMEVDQELPSEDITRNTDPPLSLQVDNKHDTYSDVVSLSVETDVVRIAVQQSDSPSLELPFTTNTAQRAERPATSAPTYLSWDSDLSELTPLEDSTDEGESEVDPLEDDNGEQPDKTRTPLKNRHPGTRCSRRRCCNLLLPGLRWRQCENCRDRARQQQRDSRLNKRDNNNENDVRHVRRKLRLTTPDLEKYPPGSRICTGSSCREVVPPLISYKWKQCERCRQRRRQQRARSLNVVHFPLRPPQSKTTTPAITPHASGHTVSSSTVYQHLSLLLETLCQRLVAFLRAQKHYLQSKLDQASGGDITPDSTQFNFDGGYSVIADPAGGVVDSVVSGVIKHIEEVLRVPLRRVNVFMDKNDAIVSSFRSLHEFQIPLSSSHPEPRTVHIVKTMTGKLEITVGWDRSHAYIPGQRIAISFTLAG